MGATVGSFFTHEKYCYEREDYAGKEWELWDGAVQRERKRHRDNRSAGVDERADYYCFPMPERVEYE